MPYLVETAFDQFYEKINLNGDHRDIANSRKDRLIDLLKTNFDIIESFSTGSIPKYTAIKNTADLDIMIVLHYGKHIKNNTPTEVLQNIRDVLAEHRTTVRKNGQAVTLYYVTWPNVDIVPVSRSVNEKNEITHYNVPDMNKNCWLESRPKSHAANIEAKSSECGYNFRRIIKMIKWWNLCHGAYLQSYHIEVIALKILQHNLDNDLSWHLFQFFEKAREQLQCQLWHDLGFVDEYLSIQDRQEVLKRFDTAISKSRAAWLYTYNQNKDHKSAIEYWKQVFGSEFPTYG